MNKIGIIGAMELEVETLKENMNVTNIVEKASMKFYEGNLGGTDVVIVRSGICKVNAGMCVQILADLFHVTHIINTGVAGSLNSAINIGDIVVSTEALYHDVDATIWGYQPGEVPQIGRREFPADGHLVTLVEEIFHKTNPDIQVFPGRIASGDQFISDKEAKKRIVAMSGALCTEMEGAAIAQASTLNSIPFVIIRAISDKADESAQIEYPEFERKAAKDCAALVMQLIPEI